MKQIVVYYKKESCGHEILETLNVKDEEYFKVRLEVFKRYLALICPYVSYELIEQRKYMSDDRSINISKERILCHALERLIENEIDFVNDYDVTENLMFEISVEEDNESKEENLLP